MANRRAIATTVLAGLALPAAAFVSSPILARGLGPTGRGELAQTLAPTSFAALLLTLGIPEAAIFFIAAGFLDNRTSVSRATIAVALLVSFVAGVVGSLALTVAQPLLFQSSPEVLSLATLVSWTLPFALLISSSRAVIQASGGYALVNFERWASTLIRLVFVVAFFATGNLSLVVAVVVVWGAGFASALLFIPRLIQILRASRPRLRADPILRYGVKVWSGTVATLLILRTDQLFLASFSGPSELAFYVIAVAVAEIPQTAIVSIQQLMQTRASSIDSDDEFSHISRLAIAGALTSCAVACFLVSPAIQVLYGADFAPAASMAIILLVGTVPAAFTALWSSFSYARGRPLLVTTAQVTGFCINISLLIVLVPRMGALGAAIASLVAYIASAAVLARLLKSILGVSFFGAVFIRKSDVRRSRP